MHPHGRCWTGGSEAISCSAPRRQLHLWQRQSTAFTLGVAVSVWKAENFPSVDLKALFMAAFTSSAPHPPPPMLYSSKMRLPCSGPEPTAWAHPSISGHTAAAAAGRRPASPRSARIGAQCCPASAGTQLGGSAGFSLSSVPPDCHSCAGFLTRNQWVLRAFPP